MIVLDRSLSMSDQLEGARKWDTARAAVGQMISAASGIHFGIEMFSAGLTICNEGTIAVNIGPDNASAIQATLPNDPDGLFTQIAGGLRVGGTDPALADPSRSNGIVLITDGVQNCQGALPIGAGPFADDPIAVIKTLFARTPSIRTWVVGFGAAGADGGDGVDPTTLTEMAVHGGTARASTPRYYQANVAADLEAALKSISNSAQSCTFKLTKTPGDLSKLFIAINGQLVPRDTNRVVGWDFDPATNTVTLYGPPCDALANTAGAQLSVQYGCPDGFIEGGGDGGFDFEIG